ncbi:methylmalonyl-CoA epimerase [Truepera radiovictrix]|uniref:Methylmalonyl-CoA epimerase n=1 Tax=Truepera radiovictrix (strain DSM 17093 / CIP 108686 / LMG 22925 / RQ-24) TaxID=649638 RepID=D7CQ96_TRURR|nr:methylmalonyl-CoA epimerase [Truepera radiovictrix]ADI14880.1 methylmalonyl-CoA epimerase [Truepera radiovictrix DSM 17093]WMT56569.1 methylmalonyl-CoA epimerase [Truepera radiovictrix]
MSLPHPLKDLPLDHIGVATPDLDAASAPFELLGLPRDGDDEELSHQGVRVRAFRSGESLVELLEPTTPESPIRSFLERRGPGLHHLALRVTRLEAEVARLKAAGARFVSDAPRGGRHGTRVVFLHPKWAGGVLVELVEHPTHTP